MMQTSFSSSWVAVKKKAFLENKKKPFEENNNKKKFMYYNRRLTLKDPAVRLTQNRFGNHTVLIQTKDYSQWIKVHFYFVNSSFMFF